MVSSSFEIADHFGTDGSKFWWKFTYNSGLMVGAAVELFKATKDTKYPIIFIISVLYFLLLFLFSLFSQVFVDLFHISFASSQLCLIYADQYD